jgi:rRNA maturation endonuclease Nob1
MARIQDLERNLAELTALLAEDSGLQDAYAQLQQENEELRGMLVVQKEGGESDVEAANELLKDNLLKQNEEMEELYRELQEARNSQSRLQERGHSEHLESKVQELNDEVSNLLVKIHELVDENNAQQESLA